MSPALSELLLRSIPCSPQIIRYQALLDDAVEKCLSAFDPDQGLLPLAKEANRTGFQHWSEEWPIEKRRQLAGLAEYHAYYNQGRESAAHLGRFAFCLAHPLSRLYGSSKLLDALRAGLKAYIRHQLPSGEFAFCPVRYSTIYGTHEMAWRLEPLIYAFAWAADRLPEDERRAAEEMLRRASEFLLQNVCTDPNNRGCVWAAITLLCGLWMEDERFYSAARKNWELCVPHVFTPSGMVAEQGGPCANYSYTGFSYVYLYRLFSGDTSLDDRMVNSLKWFSLTHTRSGHPFEGTSTRKRIVLNRCEFDILPGLLTFADREPYFFEIAERTLQREIAKGHTAWGHMVSPFIWMMLAGHERADLQTTIPEPEWHKETFLDCRTDLTRYYLIRRGYQTSVVMRSLQPMKCLQTWAFGDEPPILHPGDRVYSKTQAWGLDTAAMNCSTRIDAANFYDYLRGQEPVSWLAFRHETLWTYYIFTPVSTVMLLAGDLGRRVTQWALNRAAVPQPHIGHGVVRFEGLKGSLYYLGQTPFLKSSTEPGVELIESETEKRFSIFAFSNDSFEFGVFELSLGSFEFTDQSGHYQIVPVEEGGGIQLRRTESGGRR